MTTIINHARNSSATIQWNGDLWVAKLNGTRYADCNNKRLTERLYDAGASMVFEEFTMPPQRTTVWQKLRNAAAALLKR